MRRRDYKFEGTEEILDAIRDAEPTRGYVFAPPPYRPSDIHQAGRVTWIGTKGYLVAIPVENVNFMEGNMWYPGHAAALLENIENGANHILEVPSGRVYRVTAKDVKQSEKFERDGELSYQLGMTSPWTRDDIGSYHAQLLDGNHRAAAAMLAGDQYIYVYVGENYRENVYKKDFE